MSHNNLTKNVRGENQSLLRDGSHQNGATITPVAKKGAGGDSVGGEKTPFLTEPVRLTPAWEEVNVPDDELNFRTVTMEQAHLELNPPRDRFNLVYMTIVLHGIGALMPWNMFITAKSYFVGYKLDEEYTGVKSDYATNFLPYVAFAAQVPNLVFNWLNIFIRIGGNLTKRIVWSITIAVLVFVFTVVLAMMDTSSWPGGFFYATMTSVVILNMANGIYQNTVFGMAAKLPFEYTGAVVLGSNISGTLASIIDILSGSVFSSVRTAAIYYFITALFILLLCFDTYFALPLNRFYRYHELLNQKEVQSKKRDNHGRTASIPYWYIFKQCSPQLFNVFFIFFVTLTIFPAMHSDVKRSDTDFLISEQFFDKITCFLTFNVSATLGNFLSSWITWPKPNYLVIPVLLRFLYIPLFLVFNYQPKNIARSFPVLITNDWIYWGTAVTMGLTSGYFSSLGMMYTPRTVEPQHAVTAGMFGAAALISGISCGILLSMTLPWFVATMPAIF